MKHFLDVTVQADALEYLDALGEGSVVIYSPTSAKRLGLEVRTARFINAHSIGKDAATIKSLFRQKVDKIVALGGGTPIDIAKYAAHILGCEAVCIPTMLSTNAFATNKVALTQNDRKITFDAKLPDKIILDPEVIIRAGALNLYGLCDILSIHTALYDWMIADKAGKEKIDSEIFMASQQLLKKSLLLCERIANPTSKDISGLFALIGESGHITNMYGSGRPESGSEHIFAKEFEQRINIPHGISIAIGITIMSQLQDNYSEEVQQSLHQLGVLDEICNRPNLRTVVEDTLMNLSPRKDRYTILDKKLVSSEKLESLMDDLFKRSKKVTYEYSVS